MAGFLGEIKGKIDSKGRIVMPARFLKQMPENHEAVFVLNRGIEKCLTFYTLSEWQKVMSEMKKLNLYGQKQRLLYRFFARAFELTLDSTNRLLLPKDLLSYASLSKEVLLLGLPEQNRIEIWNPTAFEELMDFSSEDFAKLANEVMGDKPNISINSLLN